MFARSVAGVTTPPAASMVTAALLAGVTTGSRLGLCWGVPSVEEPGEGGVQ